MLDSVAQPHPEALVTLNSLGIGDQRIDVVRDIDEAAREHIGAPGCQRQYKLHWALNRRVFAISIQLPKPLLQLRRAAPNRLSIVDVGVHWRAHSARMDGEGRYSICAGFECDALAQAN